MRAFATKAVRLYLTADLHADTPEGAVITAADLPATTMPAWSFTAGGLGLEPCSAGLVERDLLSYLWGRGCWASGVALACDSLGSSLGFAAAPFHGGGPRRRGLGLGCGDCGHGPQRELPIAPMPCLTPALLAAASAASALAAAAHAAPRGGPAGGGAAAGGVRPAVRASASAAAAPAAAAARGGRAGERAAAAPASERRAAAARAPGGGSRPSPEALGALGQVPASGPGIAGAGRGAAGEGAPPGTPGAEAPGTARQVFGQEPMGDAPVSQRQTDWRAGVAARRERAWNVGAIVGNNERECEHCKDNQTRLLWPTHIALDTHAAKWELQGMEKPGLEPMLLFAGQLALRSARSTRGQESRAVPRAAPAAQRAEGPAGAAARAPRGAADAACQTSAEEREACVICLQEPAARTSVRSAASCATRARCPLCRKTADDVLRIFDWLDPGGASRCAVGGGGPGPGLPGAASPPDGGGQPPPPPPAAVRRPRFRLVNRKCASGAGPRRGLPGTVGCPEELAPGAVGGAACQTLGRGLCARCGVSPATHAAVPCGHLCACGPCARSAACHPCPVCARTTQRRFLRIFG
ncbi:unnamed protein product [Prorocentrum cordatum]|uniref:RING-type domain-containing protein n=1 Tax=Prorocentrum cordatum TaxID=2364126 RepID=A0ABN9SU21_9DINO|nr:unnamed protein product [Polarella glacialis]